MEMIERRDQLAAAEIAACAENDDGCGFWEPPVFFGLGVVGLFGE